MGLGKTIQVIAFLAALRVSKLRDIGFSYIGLGENKAELNYICLLGEGWEVT